MGNNGYTFDGFQMAGSRMKLLRATNFGADGTFGKSVSITDGYGSAGDFTSITAANNIDIFYFGIINTLYPSLIAFTSAELDSLYDWSNSILLSNPNALKVEFNDHRHFFYERLFTHTF